MRPWALILMALAAQTASWVMKGPSHEVHSEVQDRNRGLEVVPEVDLKVGGACSDVVLGSWVDLAGQPLVVPEEVPLEAARLAEVHLEACPTAMAQMPVLASSPSKELLWRASVASATVDSTALDRRKLQQCDQSRHPQGRCVRSAGAAHRWHFLYQRR